MSVEALFWVCLLIAFGYRQWCSAQRDALDARLLRERILFDMWAYAYNREMIPRCQAWNAAHPPR